MHGATALEKILHGAHMHETWNRASMAYRIVKDSPPKVWKVCPCLLHEESSIAKGVGIVAMRLKTMIPDRTPITGERHDAEGNLIPSLVKNTTTAWKWWREMVLINVDDVSVFHIALYIYCKYYQAIAVYIQCELNKISQRVPQTILNYFLFKLDYFLFKLGLNFPPPKKKLQLS